MEGEGNCTLWLGGVSCGKLRLCRFPCHPVSGSPLQGAFPRYRQSRTPRRRIGQFGSRRHCSCSWTCEILDGGSQGRSISLRLRSQRQSYGRRLGPHPGACRCRGRDGAAQEACAKARTGLHHTVEGMGAMEQRFPGRARLGQAHHKHRNAMTKSQ